MTRNPYFVTADTALDLVTSHMVEHHLSSALVIHEDGNLIGIFTESDALRALADVLQTRGRKAADQETFLSMS